MSYSEPYTPSFQFRNGHVQTLYPSLYRNIDTVSYTRERINTFDGDFLDLDWSVSDSDSLVIISHGLEGNTSRHYVKGMVQAVNRHGFDALAWNFRGCSGEVNKLPRLYHSGATEDLDAVIKHVVTKYSYKEIFLTGFSMGGNLSLVYLGRKGRDVPDTIKKCMVFSVPCDLKSSCEKMGGFTNRIYMKRFLRMLREKIIEKKSLYPDLINDDNYEEIRTFYEFDNRYTAPMHGFKNALDYWKQSSSASYIKDIQIETVIVNSKDDPFLSEACFPVQVCNENKYVSLIATKYGGHVGFVLKNKENEYWSEKAAVEYFKK